MALAVSGLSPVTITVRRPIRRSRSKRSAMPGLRMSSSTTMPAMRLPSLTSSGVAPLAATLGHGAFEPRRARSPFCCSTWRRIASGAPLRICRPSGRSTPLIRVWAVKGMNRAPAGTARSPSRPCRALGRRCRRRRSLWNKSTMLLPSGVSSAAEARAARSADFRGGEVAEGDELRGVAIAHGDRAGLVQQQRIHVAGHFHRLAALGEDVGPQGPVHAGDADGRQQGADGRGDQADQQGHQRGHVGAQALHRLRR